MTRAKRITITVELPEELAGRIACLPEDERQTLAAEALGAAAASLDLGPLLLPEFARPQGDVRPEANGGDPARARRRWDAFFREQDAQLHLRQDARDHAGRPGERP